VIRTIRQARAADSLALPSPTRERFYLWSYDQVLLRLPCVLCGDELSWELLRGDAYELDVFRCKPCGLKWERRTELPKPEPKPEPVPAPKFERKPLFCRLLGCA
jgi:hypothetical protein